MKAKVILILFLYFIKNSTLFSIYEYFILYNYLKKCLFYKFEINYSKEMKYPKGIK